MRKDVNQLPQIKESPADSGMESEHHPDQANVTDHRPDHPSQQEASLQRAADSLSEKSTRHVDYMNDLFQRSPAAIVAINEQFMLHDANPAALARFALTPAAIPVLSCRTFLRCRNLNGTVLCGTSNCPLVRVLQHDEVIASDELFLGTETDSSSEYSVGVTPAYVAGQPIAVFEARDITALKVANQVRANFVSMVSHELRTPLNSVHGFVDLLMQGHMGSLTAEQQKYLGYAQEGVQQLLAIVEDILFMTRSDSGQFEMKFQKVNARVLAKQVVTSLKPQALKAAVLLEKDIPPAAPYIYADPQRMKQVLNNLVTNAIKFTPPFGKVTIRVLPDPQQPTMALFSVIDTGYGIPPEDQPHVFERFYQSNHAMQSKMGGYGLGLSIARLIVEQHGGKISLESQPQENENSSIHGTTFSFTTPLYRGQDAATS